MQKQQKEAVAQFFNWLHFNCFNILYTYVYYLISGGTIGLFTGLSLISVVELAFWIYKTIKQYFAAACSKRKVRA